MEQLNYRTNDRTFPDEPLQRIFAEKFMDLMLPDMTPGKTVLEGLTFDHEGYLYVCVPVQEILLKIDTEQRKVIKTIQLPHHIKPAACKIHRNHDLYIAGVVSDHGSVIAVLSPDGDLKEIIPMTGRHIDDLVFDETGGFYCSDLSGTLADKKAGILHVSADHKQITPVIESGLIKTNGIALSPDWKSLWFTEFASGTLNQIVFGHDGFAEENMKTFTPYHFTGLEGPDSMVIDSDGNIYVAMTSQGRCMVFNPKGFPTGEILIPERYEGRMLKSTHITIQPGNRTGYICTCDMETGEAALYRAGVYAAALPGFAFSE